MIRVAAQRAFIFKLKEHRLAAGGYAVNLCDEQAIGIALRT